ncbi:Class I heat shock protein [Heracleum sosnowskyi]|uniref:Class I heat shock protein n=1 Tax=Heracleum sosnowskyi TaxID=360622 RepID=A0AAD8I6L1_9APIA|nr:Class I heat shock protein [Heracleum sosnowskyi]
MKIHPLSVKPNITLFLENRNSPIDQTSPSKLLRLPHVFAKVLELPFPSHADVMVQDTPNSVKFTVEIENFEFFGGRDSMRAHVVEIYCGITKVVIRNVETAVLLMKNARIDVWRYRLPAAAQPELTTAGVLNGKLVVTVPKSGDFRVLRT